MGRSWFGDGTRLAKRRMLSNESKKSTAEGKDPGETKARKTRKIEREREREGERGGEREREKRKKRESSSPQVGHLRYPYLGRWSCGSFRFCMGPLCRGTSTFHLLTLVDYISGVKVHGPIHVPLKWRGGHNPKGEKISSQLRLQKITSSEQRMANLAKSLSQQHVNPKGGSFIYPLISLIKNSPPPEGRHRALGIVLL